MAIEGPLRELGIHDVFALLDLSRKTGALTVSSELRDNEGTVWFDAGKVIYATIRSNPHPLGAMLVRSGKVTEGDLQRALELQHARQDGRRFGEILVELGALTQRELERQVRLQVEEVVFELMSWREGFFSFNERPRAEIPGGATLRISTESLLMEGARRIDEWSRIADKVPHLGVVPVLALVHDDHAAQLDLLPNEWEMLTMIDGVTDLRGIATALTRSEFDVAKIAYGLVATGVVELSMPQRVSRSATLPALDAAPHLGTAERALSEDKPEEALGAARAALAADAGSVAARLLAAKALRRLGRFDDSADELRRAAQLEPANADVALELAFAAARQGRIEEALERWARYLVEKPEGFEATTVREAMDAARRLRDALETHARV